MTSCGKLAARKLAKERPGQTLEATALVHEAYLRLAGDQHFENRGHFFAAAAEAMRRILVDNARRKASGRHGGKLNRQALDPDQICLPERADDLLALDEALDRLEAVDPAVAAVVRLRLLCRHDHPRSGRGPGRCAADGRRLLGLRQGLAPEELEK